MSLHNSGGAIHQNAGMLGPTFVIPATATYWVDMETDGGLVQLVNAASGAVLANGTGTVSLTKGVVVQFKGINVPANAKFWWPHHRIRRPRRRTIRLAPRFEGEPASWDQYSGRGYRTKKGSIMPRKIDRFLWWTTEIIEVQGARIHVSGGVYSPEYRARKVPPQTGIPGRRSFEDDVE